jgi:hypothetical protein
MANATVAKLHQRACVQPWQPDGAHGTQERLGWRWRTLPSASASKRAAHSSIRAGSLPAKEAETLKESSARAPLTAGCNGGNWLVQIIARALLNRKSAAGTSEDDRHQSHKLRKVEAVFCLQPFEMLEHACH